MKKIFWVLALMASLAVAQAGSTDPVQPGGSAMQFNAGSRNYQPEPPQTYVPRGRAGQQPAVVYYGLHYAREQSDTASGQQGGALLNSGVRLTSYEERSRQWRALNETRQQRGRRARR